MMHRSNVGPLEVTYDDSACAVYIYLPKHPRSRGSVCTTLNHSFDHGVLLDLDASQKLIGVEIILPSDTGQGEN